MAGGSSATTQKGRPDPKPKKRRKKAASKTRKSFPLKSPQKFIKGVFEIGQVPASEPLMAAHEKRIFHYPLRRRIFSFQIFHSQTLKSRLAQNIAGKNRPGLDIFPGNVLRQPAFK